MEKGLKEHDGTMTDEVFQSMEESCHGVRYTEQQIDDYCSDMENVHVSSRFDLEGVQIIRQLQDTRKNRDL